jgi:hypothetical protein
MADYDVSCIVSTVGLVIPFVVLDGGLPISNALSATVVWISQRGISRTLTLESPVSASFIYTTSAHDFRTPMTEEGYLAVRFPGSEFPTQPFTVRIHGHFD